MLHIQSKNSLKSTYGILKVEAKNLSIALDEPTKLFLVIDRANSVWIRVLPPPFLPSLNTRALFPFSLITQQVEMTYQSSKSFHKRIRSIDCSNYIQNVFISIIA